MILCWLVSLLLPWMCAAWELIYSLQSDITHRLPSRRYLTRWMRTTLSACVGCFSQTLKLIGLKFIHFLCYRASILQQKKALNGAKEQSNTLFYATPRKRELFIISTFSVLFSYRKIAGVGEMWKKIRRHVDSVITVSPRTTCRNSLSK